MVKYHARPSLQYRYEHYDPYVTFRTAGSAALSGGTRVTRAKPLNPSGRGRHVRAAPRGRLGVPGISRSPRAPVPLPNPATHPV